MGVSGDYGTKSFRANFGDRDRRHHRFTMFVGNLPKDMDEEWMGQIFSTAGNVIEVFIPKKRSTKQNWRFGFVRYARKEEGLKAIHSWNATVIRDHKIFVKFARFACQWSSRGVIQNVHESNPRIEAHKTKIFTNYQDMPDGKFVDKGNSIRNFGFGKPSIRVFEEGNEWLRRSIVAKLYPTRSLVFIQDHLQNLGYVDVLVRPMGGDQVVLTFQSVEDRNSALSKKGTMGWINEYFQEFKKWEETTNLQGPRLVWLNCYGVPINVWNSKSFSKLGMIWGDVILISDETIKQHSFTVGKVLVSTKCMDTINKVVSLQIKDKSYDVRIVEEQLVVNTVLKTECKCNGCIIMDKDPTMEKSAKEDEDNLEDNYAELEKYSPVMKEAEDDGIIDVDMKVADSEEFVADSVPEVIEEGGTELEREKLSLSLVAVNASQDNIVEMVADSLESVDAVRDSLCSSSLGKVASDLGRRNGLLGMGATSLTVQLSNYPQVQMDVFGPGPIHPIVHERVEQQLDERAIQQPSVTRRKKKKSINQILGLPKSFSNYNGGRKKQKCVLFRSAVAAAAMSATTSGIENRNRILLNEAQTIWSVNKIMGLGYDGDEDEVISRLMIMEAQDQERVAGRT